MTYKVRLTGEAHEDLDRLYDFLLKRDLVALFEIEDDHIVTVTAIRHQREEDYQ